MWRRFVDTVLVPGRDLRLRKLPVSRFVDAKTSEDMKKILLHCSLMDCFFKASDKVSHSLSTILSVTAQKNQAGYVNRQCTLETMIQKSLSAHDALCLLAVDSIYTNSSIFRVCG